MNGTGGIRTHFRHLRIAPRLDVLQRRTLYVLLALLFVSGALWMLAEYLLPQASPAFDPWPWQAWSLRVHGIAALATLFVAGTLFYGHMLLAWQQRRNRRSGLLMAACLLLLVVSTAGIYYAASGTLRDVLGWLHQGAGIILPALLVWHVRRGQASRRQASPDTAAD